MRIVGVLLLLFVCFFFFTSFVSSTLYAFPLDDLHSLDLQSKRFSITFQAMRVWVYVRRHTKMLRCILCFILINLFDYHMNRWKRAQNTNTQRRRRRRRNKHIFNTKSFTFLRALCLLFNICYVNVSMFVCCVSPTFIEFCVASSPNIWNVRRNLFFRYFFIFFT